MTGTLSSDVYDIILLVRGLFHRLAATADALHEDLGVTASQRAVLESLSVDGAVTVPALARQKGVSRQHIQTIVNDLLAARHVETVANPAHERSPLVQLTGKGRETFAIIRSRERKLLAELSRAVRGRDLAETAATLGDLHAHLEGRR